MAKKLGKKSAKKGFDKRDGAVVGCYLIFFIWIGIIVAQSMKGNKEVKDLETRLTQMTKRQNDVKKDNKALSKQLSKIKAEFEDSKAKFAREEEEYKFVVGTSLEYAKKNKLLMAVGEAIGIVRNVALKSVVVEKNDVVIEMLTQSDVNLTEFMTELNKRKDLIQTIQITETKTEKIGDKGKTKEILVGILKIVAKRPNTKAKVDKSKTTGVDPSPAGAKGEGAKSDSKAKGGKKSKGKKKGSRKKRRKK